MSTPYVATGAAKLTIDHILAAGDVIDSYTHQRTLLRRPAKYRLPVLGDCIVQTPQPILTAPVVREVNSDETIGDVVSAKVVTPYALQLPRAWADRVEVEAEFGWGRQDAYATLDTFPTSLAGEDLTWAVSETGAALVKVGGVYRLAGGELIGVAESKGRDQGTSSWRVIRQIGGTAEEAQIEAAALTRVRAPEIIESVALTIAKRVQLSEQQPGGAIGADGRPMAVGLTYNTRRVLNAYRKRRA